MVAIVYPFQCGTLMVTILVRFSLNFRTGTGEHVPAFSNLIQQYNSGNYGWPRFLKQSKMTTFIFFKPGKQGNDSTNSDQ